MNCELYQNYINCKGKLSPGLVLTRHRKLLITCFTDDCAEANCNPPNIPQVKGKMRTIKWYTA